MNTSTISSKLRRLVLRASLRFMKVHEIYDRTVEQLGRSGPPQSSRQGLESLLTKVNQNNPHFRGQFTEFLQEVADADDQEFLRLYAQLPVYSKQDYATAGTRVMSERFAQTFRDRELRFSGNPLTTLRRLRAGDFMLPMSTGGSTSLPLTVYMDKTHTFEMLFTFFKCWRKMGWNLGDKMLVFYPADTYNIEEFAKFNRISRLTGFRLLPFRKIDEPTVRSLVEELNRFRPKLLLVFPSPMNMVAHAVEKYDLPLKHQPELINVSGETFFDCQRANIQRVFSNSRIEDSYGSVELGEIAHEDGDGLEGFADVAYVESQPNEAGMPELITTRLGLDTFPFIRYKMKDIAEVERRNGTFVLKKIEGKDQNFILSDSSRRLYPSFFNRFVNAMNERFDDAIIEVKVYEKGQRELDVLFITRDEANHQPIRQEAARYLREKIGDKMRYNVQFVDFIDHDYRKKYRVIQRLGDVEYAGGIVGDEEKLARIDGPAP